MHKMVILVHAEKIGQDISNHVVFVKTLWILVPSVQMKFMRIYGKFSLAFLIFFYQTYDISQSLKNLFHDIDY